MAFEISVPARFGDALVRNLMAAGEQFGVTPYGTEALGVMRIEKGHVAGAELNGMTTAADLGLGKMMSTKKDFIGRVMAGREALVGARSPGRRRHQGRSTRRVACAPARISSGRARCPAPQTDGGYVTSVCFSPTFDRWLGLGLVSHGRERIGEIATAHDPLRGEDYEVELCNPVFYDPEGGRQRG